MPRCAGHRIAVVLAFALLGCGGDDGTGGGGGGGSGEGGPMMMNPPNGPPGGGGLCVCPGFFGRPFGECAKEPFNGDIAINFVCPLTSAVFNGNCHFQVTSSNTLALFLDEDDVFIPRTAVGMTVQKVFQTQANDPPGGQVAISVTDLAINQTETIGNVLVSNNCP